MQNTVLASWLFRSLHIFSLLIPASCCFAEVSVVASPTYSNLPLDSAFITTFTVHSSAGNSVGAFDADIVYDRNALQITNVEAVESGWQDGLQVDAASFKTGKTRVTGLRPPANASSPSGEPAIIVSWKIVSPRASTSRLAFELRSLIDDKWKPIGVTSWPSIVAIADVDTDSNGMPDSWELAYFGKPTGASVNADPDSDGFTNLQEYHAGTNPLDANLSPASVTSRMQNFSVRSTAGSGDQSLIVGFSLSGEGTKEVLIRGIGPTLTQFGVVGALNDPRLQIFKGITFLDQNDNWLNSVAMLGAFTRVGAFPLATDSKDSAILTTLGVDAYSAQLVAGGPSGIGLLEAYDADPFTSRSKFVNISARNQVGTGANILIAGFTVSGNAPKTLLIRAIGPTLGQYGVNGALLDPVLSVFSGPSRIDTNDDWAGTPTLLAAFAQVGAFALASNSRDSALIVTVQPGAYSAQVSGANGTTGVALVEIYELR